MDPIKTSRLMLRNFRQTDAADLFEYLNQPTASCFFSMAVSDGKGAENEAIKRGQGDSQIAVCLLDSGTLIGDVFAEREDDTYSVGWHFNPSFQGNGYAFEAATALFEHLFSNENARRLYAYVEVSNPSSRKLCEKLGMREEGLFKEFVSFETDECGTPVYEDTLQFAILHKEWRQGRPVD